MRHRLMFALYLIIDKMLIYWQQILHAWSQYCKKNFNSEVEVEPKPGFPNNKCCYTPNLSLVNEYKACANPQKF
jgi:hypothetical protein